MILTVGVIVKPISVDGSEVPLTRSLTQTLIFAMIKVSDKASSALSKADPDTTNPASSVPEISLISVINF